MHEAGLPHEGISRAAAELERRRAVAPTTVMSDFEAFFAPYERAVENLKAQDRSAIPTALAFLEADPECFRSGYMKADLMHALANGPDLNRHRARVQGIVAHRLRDPRPRLLRHTARLAAAVWDDDLDRQVAEIYDLGDERQRRDAERLRALVTNQRRSVSERSPDDPPRTSGR